MEALKDLLWPIALAGGLGAFVDFLIGKAGQEKAKDFLLKWWVRFDDVRWRNFGREEALFAKELMERCFGKTTYSVQRITMGVILLSVTAIMIYIVSLIKKYNIMCYWCNQILFHALIIFASAVGLFCLSVSFLILLTSLVARLCGVSEARNLLLFLVLLIVNYLMLIYVSPVIVDMRTGLRVVGESHVIDDPVFSSFQSYLRKGEIDRSALFVLGTFPSIFRFGLSIVFAGSFLLKPLLMRPVSLSGRG